MKRSSGKVQFVRATANFAIGAATGGAGVLLGGPGLGLALAFAAGGGALLGARRVVPGLLTTGGGIVGAALTVGLEITLTVPVVWTLTIACALYLLSGAAYAAWKRGHARAWAENARLRAAPPPAEVPTPTEVYFVISPYRQALNLESPVTCN